LRTHESERAREEDRVTERERAFERARVRASTGARGRTRTGASAREPAAWRARQRQSDSETEQTSLKECAHKRKEGENEGNAVWAMFAVCQRRAGQQINRNKCTQMHMQLQIKTGRTSWRGAWDVEKGKNPTKHHTRIILRAATIASKCGARIPAPLPAPLPVWVRILETVCKQSKSLSRKF